MVVRGLEFSAGSPIFLSFVDVQAKSSEYPRSEESLHMSMLDYQWAYFTKVGKGEQGQILGYHPMAYCGAMCTLRQHLKDPLLSLLHEGNLIL